MDEPVCNSSNTKEGPVWTVYTGCNTYKLSGQVEMELRNLGFAAQTTGTEEQIYSTWDGNTRLSDQTCSGPCSTQQHQSTHGRVPTWWCQHGMPPGLIFSSSSSRQDQPGSLAGMGWAHHPPGPAWLTTGTGWAHHPPGLVCCLAPGPAWLTSGHGPGTPSILPDQRAASHHI